MGKGGYTGGSTVIGPRSGWFTTGQKPKKKGTKKGAQPRNAYSAKSLILNEKEAQARGLTRQEWHARLKGRAADVRAEIVRQEDAVIAANRKLQSELDRLDELKALEKTIEKLNSEGHSAHAQMGSR
jgi:hypothetical protein